MSLLTKAKKSTIPLAGAVFLQPLLNFFAPSVKPYITQFIQSDEVKELLTSLIDSATETGSGVCVEFLAANAEKLLGSLKQDARLDEALVVALQQALKEMRDDLRKKTRFNILNSFEQYFIDWNSHLEKVRTDELYRKDLLETKQFAQLFYVLPNATVEERVWWPSIKSELAAWTKYGSMPHELESYVEENLLPFVDDALTNTLNREDYRKARDQFFKSLGVSIFSTLKGLEAHLLKLKHLARITSGNFIQDEQQIEMPLRKPVDSLIKSLVAKKIYIKRDVIIIEEKSVKIRGLHDMAANDGYFFLAAPAGSGKSTLMAHWIHEFASSNEASSSQPSPQICYYFYSKQEGTSDYSKGLTILSDQLLKAHRIHANINSFNPATIDAIITNTLELNHPGRLIVIIDGLDEAGDPSTATEFLSLFKRIFPPKLGENTTVIMTVRDDEGANSLQHYRKELGLPLNSLMLRDVSTDTLTSYLFGATHNKLKGKAHDQEFMEQIIAKTEGLAIYVYYLLDALAQVEESQWNKIISDLPKGFERYVSTSLPEALDGKPHWEDALSFIALVQHPLHQQDLIALSKLSGNKLKPADFDRMAWNIKRWLRNEESAWAFSHQKIGDVFYKLYVAGERPAYVEKLLAYCADWRQHQSRYVLQNYAEILQQENREGELYELANNEEFLESQRSTLTDNPRALLHTLKTALVTAAGKENIPLMAKFSLAHAAAVEELSTESWLDAYQRRGYTGALEVAHNFTDLKRRVVWYLLIAWKLSLEGRASESENILRDLADSSLATLPSTLFFVAECILPTLLRTTDADLIKRIINQVFPGSYTDNLLSGSQIKEVSEQLEANASQLQLANVKALAETERYDEAETLTYSIVDRWCRNQSLEILIATLVQANRLDDAVRVFDEAAREIVAIKDRAPHHYQSLVNLVTALAHPRLLGKARQFIQTHLKTSGGVSPKTLMKLAANLIRADYLDEAEQVARSIKDAWGRSQILMQVALAVTRGRGHSEGRKRFDEATETARLIYDSSSRSQALMNIAAALVEVEQLDEAHRLFDEAVGSARSIENPTSQYYSLKKIAHTLFVVNFSAKAEEVALFMRELLKLIPESEVARTIAMGAEHYYLYDKAGQSMKSDLDASSATSQELSVMGIINLDKIDHIFVKTELAVDKEHVRSRTYALGKLATALFHAGRTREADQLFSEIERITLSVKQVEARLYALENLIVTLANVGRFDEAKHFTHLIKYSEAGANALNHLVATLTRAERFYEAEKIARTITIPMYRIQAIGTLATAMLQAKQFVKAKMLFDEAKRTLSSVKSLQVRSQALRSIAPAITGTEFLNEVNLAHTVESPKLRAYVLMNIAMALASIQRLKEARQITNSIKSPKLHARALRNIVTGYINSGRIDEAKTHIKEIEQIAHSAKNFESRSYILGQYALALIKARLFDEALRIVDEIHGGSLLIVLDAFAKEKIVESLRSHIISLSDSTDAALQACAQLILLYGNQADVIYNEISNYVIEQHL